MKIAKIIIKSLYSLIVINFFIKKNKIKTIFYYHPERSLTGITKAYINEFIKLQSKEYLIISGHQNLYKNYGKNNYYIHQKFLFLIYNIDYFLSSYVSDHFTNKSIKIYVHHDIYDTPISDNKKLKELKIKLLRYNYIFVPTKDSKNYFKKITGNNIQIYILGYIKLDIFRKLIKKIIKKNKKIIIIAPTNIHSFKDFTLKDHLEDLIDYILNKTQFSLVVRPHPSNRFEKYFRTIFLKYRNNDRFNFDFSNNYLSTYLNSEFMITDISGTAFTYSFLTKNPVIFYIKSRKLIIKNKFNNLNYFKDIKKIGLQYNSIKNFHRALDIVLKKKILFKKNINFLIKKKMKYLGKTNKRFKEILFYYV